MTQHIALEEIFAVAGDFSNRKWQEFKPGVQASWVYENGESGPACAFLKYAPGTAIPWHWHPAHEHILVLRQPVRRKRDLPRRLGPDQPPRFRPHGAKRRRLCCARGLGKAGSVHAACIGPGIGEPLCNRDLRFGLTTFRKAFPGRSFSTRCSRRKLSMVC